MRRASKYSLVAVAFALSVLASLSVGIGIGRSTNWKTFLVRTDSIAFHGALARFYFRERIPQYVPEPLQDSYDWVGNDPFLPIAHGLGPQLFAGINQLATFHEGLNRGFRVFEVDLMVTADNQLVCFHGGPEHQLDTMTYSDYVRLVTASKGTPCVFKDLVGIAREHSDIRFILDVKNRFDAAYVIARSQLEGTGVEKSFIPQVYFFSELPQFRKDQFFAGEIFTSYRSHLTTAAIIENARRLHVRVVTLTLSRVAELGTIPSDLIVLTHPVDDPFLAVALRRRGVRGIYTSYVSPTLCPEVFSNSLRTVPLD